MALQANLILYRLPRVSNIRADGNWLLACDTNGHRSGSGAGAGAGARLGGGSRQVAQGAAAAIERTSIQELGERSAKRSKSTHATRVQFEERSMRVSNYK
eukprot:6211184-Pleurochrysis_carterae.AAC.3